MSRIYIVSSLKDKQVVRFVRANTLNAAVRALAGELYTAQAATHDELFAAAKGGKFDVLNAVEEQV